ncbi:MAG TPA: Nif3-like dinuclear metal center hexameric protein [Draconibacterium sp.]|nr:Nif3-like dinuclear metal center hexameric protein [Draconibacterium sp.]
MKTKLLINLLLLTPMFLFAQNNSPKTPQDVVNLIKKNVTCEWATQTVDNFKAGDPQTPLKGIATCMFADMQTLKEAVKQGCNFIITHEPVFYNHLDETSVFTNDPVFQEKMKFIKENNLVIFRFHDHIHRTEPDGISVEMINKSGLEQYSVKGSQTFFKVPETTVSKFSNELKKKFGLQTIRVIGNPEMKFTKLAFMAGAPGGQSHIQMLKNPEVEVVLAGEAPEWETYLYANDAVNQGKNKAVIFLGHIKSEEAGMEYCAQWLKTFITGVPIHFIEDKANFVTF